MSLNSWLASSQVRHFPVSLVHGCTPSARAVPLCIEAALNERFGFQVGVYMDEGEPQAVRVEVSAPQGWTVRVRRVGYVPLAHHNRPVERNIGDVDGLGCIPGYVPDPLLDRDSILLPEGETQAFWVTVLPGDAAAPGEHVLKATVIPERGEPVEHLADVRLYDLRLAKRRDFAVTHWFYVDALIDWYRTDLFDERFWAILRPYLSDLVEHGQDTLYVPVFTPPLDGVKRPSQLLHVSRDESDRYRFDWRDVKRYIDLARACGIDNFEWCHFVTQWGAQHAIRIYEGQGRDEKLLWSRETPVTSETYRSFLAQYLPELRGFLEAEDLLDRSFFHVSDEPHGQEHLQQYRRARAMLLELAPWMRVMDALTEIEFARQGLTDMPIPSIKTALDFVQEGIPCWCYYCCGPRGAYLNRLLDTPLPKIAMHGFLFYRWPFRGFLHWGYNYWYQSQTRNLIDPYTVQDGMAWRRGWAYGDPFVVYPGSNGPVDSLRWEIIGESLQDYALLQTVGLDRDDPLLGEIKSFVDFPKTEAWRRRARRALLTRGSGR